VHKAILERYQITQLYVYDIYVNKYMDIYVYTYIYTYIYMCIKYIPFVRNISTSTNRHYTCIRNVDMWKAYSVTGNVRVYRHSENPTNQQLARWKPNEETRAERESESEREKEKRREEREIAKRNRLRD